MRKLFFLSGLLVATFSSIASAQTTTQTINVEGLDLDAGFVSDLGTPGAVIAPTGSGFGAFSYAVGDLDIAGDGSSNDVATFSFFLNADGPDEDGSPFATIELVDGTTNSIGVDFQDNPTDNEIDPGEVLTFTQLAANVVFGDANEGELVTSDAGFTGFLARFPAGDVVQVNVGSTIGADGDPNAFSTVSFADLETGFLVSNGADPVGTNTGFGVDNIGATATFSFTPTAVPEPSSAALLFVGGMGFLIRRRR